MSTTSWNADIKDFNNQNNLQAIKQWWIGLDDKSVSLTQVIANQSSNKIGSPDEISTSPLTFTIKNPQMQDNELTWSEAGLENLSKIMAQKLYLDKSKEQLTIVSQEQPARCWSFIVNALEY